MLHVKVAVFHRDGIEVLENREGENHASFAARVKAETESRPGGLAVVEAHGTGAAVLDWLKEHGGNATGVLPSVPGGRAEASRAGAHEAEPLAVHVHVSGSSVMSDEDMQRLCERIGRRLYR